MRMDKLTVKSQEALGRAQELAAEEQHPHVGPLHLLAALLEQQGNGQSASFAAAILQKIGANLDQLRSIVNSELSRQVRSSGGQVSADPKLQAVLAAAQKEADRFKDQYLSVEHLLLGVFRIGYRLVSSMLS